jgi:hypothetical protein
LGSREPYALALGLGPLSLLPIVFPHLQLRAWSEKRGLWTCGGVTDLGPRLARLLISWASHCDKGAASKLLPWGPLQLAIRRLAQHDLRAVDKCAAILQSELQEDLNGSPLGWTLFPGKLEMEALGYADRF